MPRPNKSPTTTAHAGPSASSSAMYDPQASHRHHSRGFQEMRPVSIQMGFLAHQDGSAVFAFGAQSSLSSILGPMEVRIRDELSDRARLEVLHTPLHSVPCTPSTSFASSLRSALNEVLLLKNHPRTLVQIGLQSFGVEDEVGRKRAGLDQGGEGALSRSTEDDIKEGEKDEGEDDRDRDQSGPSTTSSRRRTPIGRLDRAIPPHPDAPIPVGEMATHVNAAMCAVLDAGFEAKATLCAASCALMPRSKARKLRGNRGWRAGERINDDEQGGDDAMHLDGKESQVILLDPTPVEESQATSLHLFAFALSGPLPRSNSASGGVVVKEDQEEEGEEGRKVVSQLLLSRSSGRSTSEELKRAREMCREACLVIREEMRDAVRRAQLGGR